MSYEKHVRSAQTLRDFFVTSESISALHKAGIYTIDDFIKCPFRIIMRSPMLMSEWESVTKCIMHAYTQKVMQGIKKE